MSVPGGTISVFKHLKQFIHSLVCFYSNLFSSFLMLLRSWVDFFQSSICSRYHFFATLLASMSLLAKAIYKFPLACSSIFCATSRFYWAFACFCCMWCSFLSRKHILERNKVQTWSMRNTHWSIKCTLYFWENLGILRMVLWSKKIDN